MSISLQSDVDVQHAQQIWADYQRQQDMSKHQGGTAGIDPVSSRVWLGDSILAVSQQLEAEGLNVPLYFVRIGQDHYYRKGGHR